MRQHSRYSINKSLDNSFVPWPKKYSIYSERAKHTNTPVGSTVTGCETSRKFLINMLHFSFSQPISYFWISYICILSLFHNQLRWLWNRSVVVTHCLTNVMANTIGCRAFLISDAVRTFHSAGRLVSYRNVRILLRIIIHTYTVY